VPWVKPCYAFSEVHKYNSLGNCIAVASGNNMDAMIMYEYHSESTKGLATNGLSRHCGGLWC